MQLAQNVASNRLTPSWQNEQVTEISICVSDSVSAGAGAGGGFFPASSFVGFACSSRARS